MLTVPASARYPLAVGLAALACSVPLLDAYAGTGWYLSSPVMVLVAALAGYLVGAWTPAGVAAGCVVGGSVLLSLAGRFDEEPYPFLDDLTFFAVVLGGPALAGATVVARARQVRELTRLQAELTEQRRAEVVAARLEEQTRLQHAVHRRLGERVSAIAVRAEGAQRAGSPDQQREALTQMESVAREALGELRDAVGWLREAPDEDSSPTPPVERPAPPPVGRLDLLVAAGIGAAMAVETLVREATYGPRWVNALAALLVAAPLVLRRRRPLLAVALTLAAGTVMSHWLTPLPLTVTAVALLVVTGYVVGAWTRGWWWVPGTALLWGGLVAMVLASPSAARDPEGLLPTLVWSALAVAAGRVAAGWQLRVRRTADAVAQLEHGREVDLRLAVARERQAVAGSLHDSVAHAMTVVCLQAGAGARLPDPQGLAGVLDTIAGTARTGLVELRSGLDSLDGEAPRLVREDVEALARRTRVRAEVAAPDGMLACGRTAAVALRVLREALVNVARHAPGARTRVSLEPRPDGLHLEVTDSGAAATPYAAGTGTGLTGLRATVAEAGGVLTWASLPGGGFRVSADIPSVLAGGPERALVAP